MALHNIVEFGGKPDASVICTEAFRRAFEKCEEQGGGTVYVPAGRYLTGPIHMRSNTTLYLEAGAYVLFHSDREQFPLVRSRWEGREQEVYSPLIFADQVENCAVTGRGILDGGGAPWWEAQRRGDMPYARPRFICFQNSRNILIEGVTIVNSPAWTVNPVLCENVAIRGITIRNPWDSPNTDGINPDSCSYVRISDCHVDVGDDCVTLKSGIEVEQKKVPCKNITVTNCTMANGHGGVVIGSEMSGGVYNVVISSCVFEGTDRGLRIKTRRGRGGAVRNINVSNIIMDGVICPVVMNMYYCCGSRGIDWVRDKEARPVDGSTPQLTDFSFSDITAINVQAAAGFLYGLPESQISNIRFRNISVSMAQDPKPGTPAMMEDCPEMRGRGFLLCNTDNISFENVSVHGCEGPEIEKNTGTV